MATEEELQRLLVGERIRHVRREILGLNQPAFADRVGVSVRTVKRWEASFIAPSREKAARIAELANLASELFYPEETVEAEPIVEVRQMVAKLDERVAGMEGAFTTVFERMLGTLAEMEAQLSRQTDLLAAIEKKAVAADRADGGPKQRRPRRGNS